MWEGSYGKEPFDLRLTVLCMVRQWPVIIGCTLAGTILFGGGYYLKNVLQAEKLYCAESTYHVEYDVEEEKDVGTVYINAVTWNTYLDSGFFLDAVQERTQTGLTDGELAETLSAVLASDLRVPSTKVTTDNPELCVRIAQAVEQVMTEVFPENIQEINAISVVDSAVDAPLVEADVRPGRAFALSAVLSCFFTIVILLLKELGDDSIRLPASLWKRYGLKVVGTPEGPALKENLQYLFQGKKRVAVCTVQRDLNPVQILEELRKRCSEEELGQCSEEAAGQRGEAALEKCPEDAEKMSGWFTVPSPVLCPESCRVLREADGILLAVKAGEHAGKQLEYTKEYLEQQDCKITAAILCDADELLIRCYYFPRGRKERGGRA